MNEEFLTGGIENLKPAPKPSCRDCKYLKTLYIPPSVKGIYRDVLEQEYRPCCTGLLYDGEVMLLENKDGMCEMYTKGESYDS